MKNSGVESASTANYTWNGVMEFLKTQVKRPSEKDGWAVEKALMQEKINTLQKNLSLKTKELELIKKKFHQIEEELHHEKAKTASEKLKALAGHQRVKSDFSPKIIQSQKNHSPRLSVIFPGFPTKNDHSRINSPASGQSRGSIDQTTGPYLLKNQHKQHSSNEKPSPSQMSMQNVSLAQSPINLNHSKGASGSHYLPTQPANSCRSMKSVDEKASGGISTHRKTQSGGNLAFLIPSSFLPKSETQEDPVVMKTTRRNNRIIEHSPENVQNSGPQVDLSTLSLQKKTASNPSQTPEITRSQTERLIPSKKIQQIAEAKSKEQEDIGQHQKLSPSQQQPIQEQTIQEQPIQAQKPQITLAQKHAMVESVRKKWTVDQFQQPANNLASNNPFPINASAISSEKPHKILVSKKQNLSRPAPLNEIDELTKTVCSLRSHMDGVRGMFFSAKNPVLATISEDCTVKLWDTKQISSASRGVHIDPYYTLRAHSGPLLTITGNQLDSESSNVQENMMFTAGTEGVIRAWNVMNPDTVDNYGPCGNINICSGAWQAHEDAIWQLAHHSRENIMISSSSDAYIKLWGTSLENEGTFALGNHIGTISFKNPEIGNYDIPTALAWMYRKNTEIVAGYVNAPSLMVYNAENGKQIMQMKFSKTTSSSSQQANKIIYSEEMNFIISAHEDNRINFFDSNSGILIKSVLGHTDAVTGLAINKMRNHLASVSHDGTLRIWDLRNFQCLGETMVHPKKYDEGAHCVYYSSSQEDLIATGGADGVVKIIGYN